MECLEKLALLCSGLSHCLWYHIPYLSADAPGRAAGGVPSPPPPTATCVGHQDGLCGAWHA